MAICSGARKSKGRWSGISHLARRCETRTAIATVFYQYVRTRKIGARGAVRKCRHA